MLARQDMPPVSHPAAPASPVIVRAGWGWIEVAGLDGRLRDAMLYPGGACAWDWHEHGTDHHEGIRRGDVLALLAHGAKEVVLSRGRLGFLRVPEETLALLASRGIPVHVLWTPDAVECYNRLAQRVDGRPVGALIHTTC